MKVSVVIPTFNRAAYLKEAIDSALQQTFAGLEVVVVDDGSTDNTSELVHGLSDPRVQYIYQPNRGVAAAHNTGWRAARGEYIARLDSDDAWLHGLLASLVPALDSNPELGAIYARAQAMDAQGRPLPQILGAPPRFPGEMLKSLLYADCVCPNAVVVRKTCLERAGGYDESLRGNEDWDLWLRLAEHYPIDYRDEILARYRFHTQNITGIKSEQYDRLVQDRVRVLEKFYARPDIPPGARSVKPLAFRNLYMDITIRQLASGRRREAWTWFICAVRAGPNPIATTLRVLGVAFFHIYLSKTRWGVRLVEGLVSRRRSLAK